MIKDNLQHIDYYNYLTKELQLGLKYIKDTDFSTLENGRYDVIENKIYVNIQEYETKKEENAKFEAHKKYIDIQFIIEGQENLGVGKLEDFSTLTEYDETKDITFLAPKDTESYRFITLKEKEYAIFLPSDAHMPGINVEGTFSKVRKAVVKVLISQ